MGVPLRRFFKPRASTSKKQFMPLSGHSAALAGFPHSNGSAFCGRLRSILHPGKKSLRALWRKRRASLSRPHAPRWSARFTFTVAAEESTRIPGEYLSLDWQQFTAGRWGIVRRFPLGPIAGITPFNFPLNLVAHKVAPAIA